jgi:acylphosphatase
MEGGAPGPGAGADARRRARVVVRGRVQGVSFRAEAQARARSLGLDGWIRNEPDGSVQAVFEGPRERVRSMIEWCHRGPRGAHIDSVETTWEEPDALGGFRVR